MRLAVVGEDEREWLGAKSKTRIGRSARKLGPGQLSGAVAELFVERCGASHRGLANTGRQTDRQTDRQTHRHTDRQTDKGAEQTDWLELDWLSGSGCAVRRRLWLLCCVYLAFMRALPCPACRLANFVSVGQVLLNSSRSALSWNWPTLIFEGQS